VRIRVLSDLHLEFTDFTPPAVEADLVILAGDIHVGTKGIRWARERFPGVPVVYVAGNHEHYGQAAPRLTEKLHEEARGSNVHVLEREELQLQGARILGCTLWTDLALHGDDFVGAAAVADSMSDYKKIRVSPRYRRLRPSDTITFHKASVRWLRDAAAARPGPLIVVTHHAPSGQSLDPRFAGDRLNVAYASNLEPVVSELQPLLWVHGHIHHRADYHLGRTRVVCNPRGYPDEPGEGFDPAKVVELELGG
jgi:Icc-related predicted phosphoesterase